MRQLRHYGSIAYLRALYKACSPSGKRQKSTHHSGSRSLRRSPQVHEPPIQQYYYTGSNPYYPRQHHQPREHSYSRYPTTHHAPPITALPPELKHLIVADLDPVASACLGLASRDYYPIHRSHHRQRISLYEQADERGSLPLAMYLRDWAPKEMVLDPRSGRLAKREREPDAERSRWERRLRRSKRYDRMDVGRYRW